MSKEQPLFGIGRSLPMRYDCGDNKEASAVRQHPEAWPKGVVPLSESDSTVPYGYCHCGCGGKAPIAEYTHRKYGYVKGEPKRFIHGHAHPNSRPKPAPEYTPMSEFDFGWLVGILEGEGSFTSTTRSRKRTGSVTRTAQIIVSSTDKSTIERLSRLVPLGTTFHRDAGPPRREVWTWSLKRADVVTDLMIAIRPYMSPRRRERLDELLATCNTRSVA